MERLTTRFNNGYLFNLPSINDEKAQEEYLEKLSIKLGEYEDSEEQGLLLRLLCKVGDKVWAITTPANYSLGAYSEVPLKHPQQKKIQSITIARYGVLYHVKDRTYFDKDFGKSVFLTKEAAEQALKETKKCKYVKDNGLCGKNPACTSSGKCEEYCSYFEQALKQIGE